MRSDRTQLAKLLDKYVKLREFRRTKADRANHDLKTLSEMFPGALRELDTLPPEHLDERLSQCERALEVGHLEPWMEWMLAYHAAMRAALLLKSRLRKRRELTPDTSQELSLWLSDATGFSWDAGFVESVARPPDGRLNRVVLRRVADFFGVDPRTLATTLFPGRPVRVF